MQRPPNQGCPLRGSREDPLRRNSSPLPLRKFQSSTAGIDETVSTSDSPDILMIDSGNKVSEGKAANTPAARDASLFEDASAARQSWDATPPPKSASERPKSQRGTSLGTSPQFADKGLPARGVPLGNNSSFAHSAPRCMLPMHQHAPHGFTRRRVAHCNSAYVERRALFKLAGGMLLRRGLIATCAGAAWSPGSNGVERGLLQPRPEKDMLPRESFTRDGGASGRDSVRGSVREVGANDKAGAAAEAAADGMPSSRAALRCVCPSLSRSLSLPPSPFTRALSFSPSLVSLSPVIPLSLSLSLSRLPLSRLEREAVPPPASFLPRAPSRSAGASAGKAATAQAEAAGTGQLTRPWRQAKGAGRCGGGGRAGRCGGGGRRVLAPSVCQGG